jgi:RDD family
VSRVFRSGNNAKPRGLAASRWAPTESTRAGERGVLTTLVTMVSDAQQPARKRVRGASLGLPADGPGSLAPFGTRVVAFLVDAVLAGLVAAIFTAPRLPQSWSLVAFAAIYVVSLVVFGQTPGMRLLGLRLAHPQPGARLAVWRAVVRTALLLLLVPALVVDGDGRGLHDRLTDTAVVTD